MEDRLFKELEEKLVDNLFKEQATTGKLELTRGPIKLATILC